MSDANSQSAAPAARLGRDNVTILGKYVVLAGQPQPRRSSPIDHSVLPVSASVNKCTS